MQVKIVEKDILDPLGDIDQVKLDLNPIPHDFEFISLVDNTKPGADVILSSLAENLGKRKFITIKKPAGAPATMKQLEIASEGEIALIALGDCGSCSSWVILDAIRLEKKGVPTISICSEKFTEFAHKIAKSHGAEDLRILSVEHPIAGSSNNEIQIKTLPIIPSLKYILQIP
jgi:hypothetical protein